MADELQRIFEEAGYTYPGTPEAGARLLLSEVKRSQGTAEAESKKYAGLLLELDEALDDSPLHGAPADSVKHVALLCKLIQKEHVSKIRNAVRTLRERHKVQSEEHRDDHDFLFSLDDLTDPKLGVRLMPLVQAAVAYWRSLQRGEEHVKIAAAFTQWSQLVRRYLDDEGLLDKEDPLGFG